MGCPPEYLFIVRHGSRLDAADPEWCATSPTPYDPPLTYGGWLQSRAVGARIVGILLDDSACRPSPSSPDPSHPRRQRRFRVMLHSSPFLRCVQTAVAISAGIAQSVPLPGQARHDEHGPGPVIIGEAGGSGGIPKTALRVDAFLGEWLNPEYFEFIVPPPGSALMLVSAKAELLRRDDHGLLPHFSNATMYSPSSGALWTGAASPPVPPAASSLSVSNASAGLDDFSGMSRSLPRATRAPGGGGGGGGGGYVAPTPNYAVGVGCRIPEGLVAHAKDACVAVDYQWDSSKEPRNWGDGGTFGEEWQAMHGRFRRGLRKLVDWYADDEMAAELATSAGPPGECGAGPDEEGEYGVETVVVVVSHGAGCNAMIGAVTHKPVLTDVSISSLTMAVRKGGPGEPTPRVPRTGGVDLAETYDIKMLANTDHYLAPSSGGAGHPVPTTSASAPGPTYRSRGSSMSTFSPPPLVHAAAAGLPDGRTPSQAAPASPWSVRRASAGSATQRSPALGLHSSGSSPDVPRLGLWVPPARSTGILAEENEDGDIFPDFDQENLPARNGSRRRRVRDRGSSSRAPGSLLAAGLNGQDEASESAVDDSGSPPHVGLWTNNARGEVKRRWTVNEA